MSNFDPLHWQKTFAQNVSIVIIWKLIHRQKWIIYVIFFVNMRKFKHNEEKIVESHEKRKCFVLENILNAFWFYILFCRTHTHTQTHTQTDAIELHLCCSMDFSIYWDIQRPRSNVLRMNALCMFNDLKSVAKHSRLLTLSSFLFAINNIWRHLRNSLHSMLV